MRILIFILPFAFLFSCDEQRDCCAGPDPDPVNKELIKGADISFLPEIETAGIHFTDAAGTEKDMLDILKESGVNTIRLRLWHTPETAHSGLPEVKALSERIKAKGLKVWLSVHYSDTWADPGHQVKPAAWNEASFTDLADSVYLYTKKVMLEIDPEIIQIGNEINGGFLLPSGSTSNVPDFITLLKEGVRAAREVSADTKIMIHVAGFDVATWFYQQLSSNAVDYDYIGLSYYPIWHGKSLATVKSTIDNLGAAYGKEVMIAETAYPFSLGWEDWTNNIVGEEGQLVSGYAATPEGQKSFLLKLREIVTTSPKGAGFCYWGAEWVSFKGDEATDGSTWENQALFDFNNKAVPALDAFADED
jgi:arabinogalactan endo-1,4-beta-galactosidase